MSKQGDSSFQSIASTQSPCYAYDEQMVIESGAEADVEPVFYEECVTALGRAAEKSDPVAASGGRLESFKFWSLGLPSLATFVLTFALIICVGVWGVNNINASAHGSPLSCLVAVLIQSSAAVIGIRVGVKLAPRPK